MATMPKAKLKLRRWDSAAYLKTEEDIALYWEACLEEAAEDPAFITAALAIIAKARGMTALARETGLTREGLCKALSPAGRRSCPAPTAPVRRSGGAPHLDGRARQDGCGRPGLAETRRREDVRMRHLAVRAAVLFLLAAWPPPASADPPAVFQHYLDRTEGAFMVLVPQGWLTEGGILRVNPLAAGPGQAIEAKLDFTVKREPAGEVAIRWLPSVNYLQPTAWTVTPSVNGMPVLARPTPREFATRLLFPRLRPGARELRVAEVQARPDVVQAMRTGDKARSLVASGVRYEADAAAVTFAYLEGGVRYREVVFVAIEAYQVHESQVWSNGLTLAARAPEAAFAAHQRLARVVINSFAIVPGWWKAEAAGQTHRAAVVKATQDELARLDREIADHRRRTQAQIQDQQYLTLTGQERWVNPHTGRPELGSNEWRHRWQDGSGQVIYTDDDRWDPNADPRLHLVGFKRSPQQPR